MIPVRPQAVKPVPNPEMVLTEVFGFNLAMLEAMAAELPVIGNRHPSSPIRHGHDGFLADEPA